MCRKMLSQIIEPLNDNLDSDLTQQKYNLVSVFLEYVFFINSVLLQNLVMGDSVG